jgi:NAD(P)-dependent dehydrogenase (short-subunit alcohol dehydrogenase family)
VLPHRLRGRAISVDVRDEAAPAAAVSEAEQALGGLDIVVATRQSNRSMIGPTALTPPSGGASSI